MDIRTNVPLAPLTTIGLGGPAGHFVECTGGDDVRAALRHAWVRGLKVFVLGGGSNVVFPDSGFDGLVVRLCGSGMTFEDTGDDTLVRVWAGQPWDGFVEEAVRRGLGGIECLSGIPGSTGATPVQNVGAYGQEVSGSIVSVEAIDRGSLDRVEFTAGACRFGYRQSRFKQDDKDRYVITGVIFRLRKDARPEVRYAELERALASAGGGRPERGRAALEAVRSAVIALRRGKSMVVDPADPESRSVGSFFMNPVLPAGAFAALQSRWRKTGGTDPVPSFPGPEGVKVPAGWLVERAGYPKGYRKGNAGVSANHALALVNRGGTARELVALSEEIREAVLTKFGVRLEPEPVIVPPA